MNNSEKKEIKRKKRLPGIYKDKYSIKKDENNILIMHACKLLKAYYNEEGIKALILDGKKLRSTKTLLNLGDKLKQLTIVEYNQETYFKIINKIKKYHNIKCFKSHINDYILKNNSFNINVVYFDVMLNFFSSNSSLGSDFVINEFLSRNQANELILAATFCLRSYESMNYDSEERNILVNLNLIFNSKNFEQKQLLPNESMRYKGQTGFNKALMFVLFYLKKRNGNKMLNEQYSQEN